MANDAWSRQVELFSTVHTGRNALPINGTVQTMKAILSTLKYLLIAIGSTLSVAVFVWLAIFLFAQTISIDKAFALIFYPSVVAGVIAPLAWWLRGRRLEA